MNDYLDIKWNVKFIEYVRVWIIDWSVLNDFLINYMMKRKSYINNKINLNSNLISIDF